MAGISGPARGCPGAMSCPLAASQTFSTKDRVMLRAGRQSHLCKCRFQLPATQGQLSIIGRILLRGGLFLPKEGLWIFWWCVVVLSSVQFSHSVVSDSLRPRELQNARPPCPSPTPGVHSNSRPSSQ